MEIHTFKIKKKHVQMQETLVSAAATRSIAPPIPFTIFPGIIQLARSPHRDTFSEVHLYNIHRAKLSQNVSKNHLHGAQDSESNMSTSNHSKTLFTREEGAAWNCSHRLLPRIDQVRINLRKSINNVLDFFCTKRN